ncbi:MAG TPA: hypothetical protein VEX15_13735 [Nocardioidaceae bacterium]|nr:hypothetical protein [Nocardioidaceae bacterium]
MAVDLVAARSFMTAHARLLDRHRFNLLIGEGSADAALHALGGYRNSDGGYGWGLEPDLRSPESQPSSALHAFEAFADVAPRTSPDAAALCDWLQSVTLPDGGLPFALPLTDRTGSAPHWANAEPYPSSLQITAIVAAKAHLVAEHDPAVAAHPWLSGATAYCLRAVSDWEGPMHAIELAFAVQMLDAVHDRHEEVGALLDKLGRHIPETGVVPVAGGSEGESMRPLDFAPMPDRQARRLFTAAAVDADLQRLAEGQQPDGGWVVDFGAYSPAASLDWRGYATVSAVATLRANGFT